MTPRKLCADGLAEHHSPGIGQRLHNPRRLFRHMATKGCRAHFSRHATGSNHVFDAHRHATHGAVRWQQACLAYSIFVEVNEGTQLRLDRMHPVQATIDIVRSCKVAVRYGRQSFNKTKLIKRHEGGLVV